MVLDQADRCVQIVGFDQRISADARSGAAVTHALGRYGLRHLAKIRLGQAAGYLTTTGLSVEAIARRTGYGTNASLSKAFKREFGTSPGQYRETKGGVAVSPVRGTDAGLGAPDPGN